jgi:hypothetical protein
MRSGSFPRLPAAVLAAIFGSIVARPVRPETPARPKTPAPIERPAPPEGPASRSVWVAPTYQLLLGDAFEPSSRHGLGAAATYEFHITPSFDLGLTLAYRLYPGEQTTQQLGYGAILKHFFSPRWSRDDGVYPFVDYGLLLQQTFIEGRSGSAVSHDTRIGVGAVLRGWGVPLFVGLAGHYSRLGYFDTDSATIPYVDLEIGCVETF